MLSITAFYEMFIIYDFFTHALVETKRDIKKPIQN